MKQYAIIVAGGSGTRFGGALPKQFQLLAGRPVLMHTLNVFAGIDNCHITLVLPQSQIELWRDLCLAHDFHVPHEVVAGGSSRYESVKNALCSLRFAHGDMVAVHDGVRPLVSQELVDRLFVQAAASGSAIPATLLTDSVRCLDGGGHSVALARNLLRAVQTPQVFDATALKHAYELPYRPDFTDDASVFEKAGGTIALVEGETSNIKITHPHDLVLAKLILKNRS